MLIFEILYSLLYVLLVSFAFILGLSGLICCILLEIEEERNNYFFGNQK